MRGDALEVENHRKDTIFEVFSKLHQGEMNILEQAADGLILGGNPINKPFLDRAIQLELVYVSSGRLRTHVYKMLKGDNFTLVKRS